MGDPNCIFCKIIKKEIPAEIVYEDEVSVAFLDIHPISDGHLLLIPKEHYQWFDEVPKEIAAKWFNAAQTLASKLKQDHEADYIELSIVGKDVPHAHLHLIPRKIIS